jgi:hypothetical protein
LHEFVTSALREETVEEFVRQVDDDILGRIPQIAADPLLVEELDNSTRAHWRTFLGLLTIEDYRHELPAPAADLARSLARRGMDLGVLLKVYRAASQVVFRYFSEVTRERHEEAPARDEVLIYFWSRAGLWIDDSIEQLIGIFYAERRRLDQGALARRAAVIESLLQDNSPGIDEASTQLGHALRHWQTAFVLWTDDVERATDDRMQEVGDLVARQLGAPPPLAHTPGSRDLWGWIATPTEPDLGALSSVEGTLRDRGMRVAVGLPARGESGFRHSHEEARAAHRMATSAALPPALIRYGDVELLCLAGDNTPLLERMVQREIGPLCGADKNLALVRQTALAFLVNRNVEAVAEELFVHKNTVRYRLARAEELLGHPLTERASYVELALRRVALFGPPTPGRD